MFINSSLGITTRAGTGYYAATQHAFKAIAESLREEVNNHNVRVLSVFTGRTATPRIQTLDVDEGENYRPGLLAATRGLALLLVITFS